MTYLELINDFWSQHSTADPPFTDAETVLYLKLLDYMNRQMWESDHVRISSKELCQVLGWTPRKLRTTRQQLDDRCMIIFEEGVGRTLPTYWVDAQRCKLAPPNSLEVQNSTSKQPQRCKIAPPNDLEVQNSTSKIKVSPTPLSKDIEDKHTLPAHTCVWKPPSLEEVLSCAQQCLVTEEDAKDFWNHYETQGWYLGNGLPMARWQTALKMWGDKNKAERVKAEQHGPNVKERSKRGSGNDRVETQSPETPEIQAKRDIMQMIEASGDKEYMKQIATKAYRLRGNYTDAHQLLVYAFKFNNPDVRHMLGVS